MSHDPEPLTAVIAEPFTPGSPIESIPMRFAKMVYHRGQRDVWFRLERDVHRSCLRPNVKDWAAAHDLELRVGVVYLDEMGKVSPLRTSTRRWRLFARWNGGTPITENVGRPTNE